MSISVTTAPIAGTYVSDPVHSSFGFAVRHMGVSTFRGTLSDATVTLNAGEVSVALEGAAKVESISIANPPEFRAHVLGEEFFDAANHPEVTFRSTDVELAEDGSARVRGELTIKGIGREVEATGSWQLLPEDAIGKQRAALELSADIDRTQFGMTWQMPMPKGGKVLDERVTLEIAAELIRQEG